MAIFSAALDDSGTHVNSPFTVVGGIIMSPQGFNDFEVTWHSTLAKYGIKIFHSSDCDAGQGEFRGWSLEKRCQFSLELARIISSHVKDIMAFGTSPKDFDIVWEKLRLADIGIERDTYKILLEFCFHQLGDWARRLPPGDTLKITVEKGNKRASFINDLYCKVNEDPKAKQILNIDEIASRGKEFQALQAADLLVHKIHRYYPNLDTDIMEDTLRELTINRPKKAIKLWRSKELEEVLLVRRAGDKFFIKPKKK